MELPSAASGERSRVPPASCLLLAVAACIAVAAYQLTAVDWIPIMAHARAVTASSVGSGAPVHLLGPLPHTLPLALQQPQEAGARQQEEELEEVPFRANVASSNHTATNRGVWIFSAFPYHTEVIGTFVQHVARMPGDARPDCRIYLHRSAVEGADPRNAVPLYLRLFQEAKCRVFGYGAFRFHWDAALAAERRFHAGGGGGRGAHSSQTSPTPPANAVTLVSITPGKRTAQMLSRVVYDAVYARRVVHVIHHYDSESEQPAPWEHRVLYLTPLVGTPYVLPVYTYTPPDLPACPALSRRERRLVFIGQGLGMPTRFDLAPVAALLTALQGQWTASFICDACGTLRTRPEWPSIARWVDIHDSSPTTPELIAMVRYAALVAVTPTAEAAEMRTRLTGALPLALSLCTPLLAPRAFTDIYGLTGNGAVTYEASPVEVAAALLAMDGATYTAMLDAWRAVRGAIDATNADILNRHFAVATVGQEWNGTQWSSWVPT